MSHYFYKCFDCNTQFSCEEIESNLHYLCPKCGRADKNQPLSGVLWIEYDYSQLKKERSKAAFLSFPCGEFWHYPWLWPLEYKEENNSIEIKNIDPHQLEKVSLISKPLLEFQIDHQPLQFFDDTRNPTLSYKDRASIIVAVKALQMGIDEIAAASTGNAGSSLAGICARLGIRAHLFVPESIPNAKRLQIQGFGANIYLVQGDYDCAFDLSIEISQHKKWYNRNTAYNPLTIEGKKSAAYDIFLTSHGNVPDIIFVPVGDGVILSGIYKGFRELVQLGWIEKLPRLIAVQAQGSNALVRYLETGQFDYQSASTLADSISAGAPRNLFMAASAVKESRGGAVTVSDEDILMAQKQIAQQAGLLVEPASASSLAGYLKLKPVFKPNDRILLMMTGNGLKDIDTLNSWNQKPTTRTANEWKQIIFE